MPDSPTWRLPTKALLGLLALLIAVPPILGFMLASTNADMYRGQVDVIHRLENPSFGTTDRLVSTQELRAETRTLAQTVAEMSGRTPDQISNNLSVETLQTGVNEESTVIRISYLDQSRDDALMVIQNYTEAYLKSVSIEESSPGLAESREVIQELNAERDSIRERLAAAVASGDVDAQVQAEADYERILDDLEIQVDVWNELRPETPVVVADPGATPWVTDEPVEPRPIRSAALGLVGGLVLAGAALVLLRRPNTPIFD